VEHHGAACVVHGLGHRGRVVAARGPLLAPPADHEQGVVDGHAQPDEGDEELDDLADAGDLGKAADEQEGGEHGGRGPPPARRPGACCRAGGAGGAGRANCAGCAGRADRGRHAVMIRVLLADDQSLIRAGFRLLLDSCDDLSVVGEASDGAQAVDLARRERADVVLMDIRMPGVDGLEATRRIAADEDLAGVKVIILTTFESDEYVYPRADHRIRRTQFRLLRNAHRLGNRHRGRSRPVGQVPRARAR